MSDEEQDSSAFADEGFVGEWLDTDPDNEPRPPEGDLPDAPAEGGLRDDTTPASASAAGDASAESPPAEAASVSAAGDVPDGSSTPTGDATRESAPATREATDAASELPTVAVPAVPRTGGVSEETTATPPATPEAGGLWARLRRALRGQ